MFVVWKYMFERSKSPIRTETFFVPKDARILTVKNLEDNDDICIWFLCKPGACNSETRRFLLVYTGTPMDNHPGDYVGTVRNSHGIVTHIFETFDHLGVNNEEVSV